MCQEQRDRGDENRVGWPSDETAAVSAHAHDHAYAHDHT
jgi:hypothetical protein